MPVIVCVRRPPAPWCWHEALPRVIQYWQRSVCDHPPYALMRLPISRRRFSTSNAEQRPSKTALPPQQTAAITRPVKARYDKNSQSIPVLLRLLSMYTSNQATSVKRHNDIVAILRQIEVLVQSHTHQLSPVHLTIVSKATRASSQAQLLTNIIECVRRVHPDMVLTRSTEYNIFETYCRSIEMVKMFNQISHLQTRNLPLNSDLYDKAITACYKAHHYISIIKIIYSSKKLTRDKIITSIM